LLIAEIRENIREPRQSGAKDLLDHSGLHPPAIGAREAADRLLEPRPS
jgi:hypothetical protein